MGRYAQSRHRGRGLPVPGIVAPPVWRGDVSEDVPDVFFSVQLSLVEVVLPDEANGWMIRYQVDGSGYGGPQFADGADDQAPLGPFDWPQSIEVQAAYTHDGVAVSGWSASQTFVHP